MNGPNRAIDLLRGGCILYIVAFWHLLGYIDGIDGYKNFLTYRLTIVVLGLFTLIAGVLAGRRVLQGREQIWRYYRSRAIRILPPYGLALLLFALSGLLSWSEVGQALLLRPAFDSHPLRTLWYINMLVVFYAAAPLLQILGRWLAERMPQGLDASVLLVLALTGAGIVLTGIDTGIDPRLGVYMPAFATGVLMSDRLLNAAGEDTTGASVPGLARLWVLALVAIGLSAKVPGHDLESSLWSLPLATLTPPLVLLIALRRIRTPTIPSWLQASSTASYFIYLLHRPILKELKPLVGRMAHHHPAPELALYWGMAIPLVVAVAWWSQLLYDRTTRAMAI